tara:strand:+ start:2342 stop:3145 length:804 start_codon:yes stop_codon:yes gene_type:complete
MSDYKIIDAHSHIWSKEFDNDRNGLIERAKNNNVVAMIEVGCDFDSSIKSLDLSLKHDFIFPVFGLHPHYANRFGNEKDQLFDLQNNKKFVGIGEIGLDYNRMHSDKKSQINAFTKQLNLAVESKLPVVIHSRDAEKDTFEILKQWKIKSGNYLGNKLPVGMMHCFSGNFALATEYANLGFMISIPGTVTYPKNTALREVVSLISLDKILIETDIPYLTPVPNRGKRNETAYINFTLDEIVKIRSEDKEYVARNIFENTKKLFNLEV